MRRSTSIRTAVASLLFAIALAPGCSNQGGGAQTFDSPDAAVEALVAALEARDQRALARLLGPDSDEILSSGDAVADSVARAAFLARYHAKHQLVAGSPHNLVLQVGIDDWPLPIPLVRENGRWRLDTAAGKDEILMRRIGANELETIDVMRGVVLAQEDYASESHDGVPAGTYARKIRSSEGKHDGLYWDVAEGEPESPAGPLLAEASSEGYTGGRGPGAPYHGYHFRLLTSQGPAAEGGARDYLADGRLSGGFAMVAWPASYGSSGVMSFLINQDGTLWQKDLGETTDQVASSMTSFDPDTTWIPVPPEEVAFASE